MSMKNRIGKKVRKEARKETQQFIDGIHKRPFRIRLGFALKLLFGRDIKK